MYIIVQVCILQNLQDAQSSPNIAQSATLPKVTNSGVSNEASNSVPTGIP